MPYRLIIGFGLFACAHLVACSSDSKNRAEAGAGGQSGADGSGPLTGAAGNATAGAAGGPGGGAGGSPTMSLGGGGFELPRVYPLLRAATPATLIVGPTALELEQPSQFGQARQGLAAGINLATAVQQRFYSGGPTDLLRIVRDLDERVQGLVLDPSAHACLTAAPAIVTYALPAGQTFQVKLQCLQTFGAAGAMGSGWLGFGFADVASIDAGVAPPNAARDAGGADAADAAVPIAGRDFYLAQGQQGGNGGAYHIDAEGNVQAWIAVAERDLPSNSQVIMQLETLRAERSLELTLAGSGVGFCSAHLKTNPELLFVSGKTNAPPPPGTQPMVGTQYCDEARGGCFQASDLTTDLGAGSSVCTSIAIGSFALGVELDTDSAPDAGVANVTPGNIYTYFSETPTGIAAF